MHRDFSWYVLQVTMKFQIQNGMSVIKQYVHVHVYTLYIYWPWPG